MRLIDADALADRLDSLAYDDWNQGASTSWANAYSECAEMVRSEMPIVDAEPTEEQVREYCLKRCLTVVTTELFDEMKARWSNEPVRHGRWIERTKVYPDFPNDSTYNYECSNCGYWDTHGADVEVPYCWHCGARMDG